MKTWQPEPSVFNLVYEPIIGKNVSLVNTLLDCVNQITIGDNVSFGHNVMVLTGYHDYYLKGAERMESAPSKPVMIEDGVWIASGAIICPGVRIGKNAVVGAGAVVTRDVPAGWMVAGKPARFIKRVAS
ncbi:MAG: DapH/DapD/GlmU-related protein [Candidatus Paceibacterota bacterium]|jgi:maltose O-acetyltransferase